MIILEFFIFITIITITITDDDNNQLQKMLYFYPVDPNIVYILFKSSNHINQQKSMTDCLKS
ncbi:hypothetical protein DERP_003555 [Dermatophagoides pteronyssinus]|uniref:Uncharacterized protein n=1 Tax=Dermatophagoides pteronyssinus TaxID=6956 RepID=A0ABQ8JKY6_DERPT|nr:hypothetical protein DERP_003555 [Dermatophagoides pteronyssinus]